MRAHNAATLNSFHHVMASVNQKSHGLVHRTADGTVDLPGLAHHRAA